MNTRVAGGFDLMGVGFRIVANVQISNTNYQYPIGNIGSGNWQQFHIGYSLKLPRKHIFNTRLARSGRSRRGHVFTWNRVCVAAQDNLAAKKVA